MFRNSSTSRLRRMLEAIRSRDFTLQYSLDGLKGEERRLAEEINAVITEFRSTQARQEALYGQYETLLDQVSAMLFTADAEGRILWMNRRAIEGLSGFRLTSLSQLAAVHPSLPEALAALSPGRQQLLQLRIDGQTVDWHLSLAIYYSQGCPVRLFSIENVQTVVQQSEIESQRKIVSVLTHEIMNSLAPIISLSESLLEMEMPADSDAALALQAIHRRGTGLLQFVDNYRQLQRISEPHKETVRVVDLVADLQSLFPLERIRYEVADATDELLIDRSQMTQVLINLIKNAVEASAAAPVSVSFCADRANRRFLISVSDRGPGILPDVLDRIFLPFFTTKPHGSGIGLSICRQIVALHGGTVRVSSRPGQTEFVVQINC